MNEEPVPALKLARSISIPAETLANMSFEEVYIAMGRPEFAHPEYWEVEVDFEDA